MLKFALLGFLNYQPMTGYELKQRMDTSTTHFWHAKLSQIYVTLKALEEGGSVTSAVAKQSERPDRRVYTITPLGQYELRQWLAEPETELSPKKETLILKVFFAGQLDPQVLLAQLRLQHELHSRQRRYYRDETRQKVQQAAAEFPGLRKDAQMWEATRRFGEMYEDLYVRWLEEMIQLIGERDGAQ
jgi:PadR family transcriptional regulator, regulatory protein AphA